MTAVWGPADWTDEGVFPFDAILREFGFTAAFLEVDEGHIATAKFYLVVAVRGFGADLRRGQALRFTGCFSGLLGGRCCALGTRLARGQALVCFHDPSRGVGLETDAAILERNRPDEGPFLGGHLSLRLFGKSRRDLLMVERRTDYARSTVDELPSKARILFPGVSHKSARVRPADILGSRHLGRPIPRVVLFLPFGRQICLGHGRQGRQQQETEQHASVEA